MDRRQLAFVSAAIVFASIAPLAGHSEPADHHGQPGLASLTARTADLPRRLVIFEAFNSPG